MTSSLFSHAPEPEDRGAGTAAAPAVTVSRIVPRELHEAFNGFIEYIHLWWPESFSEYGEGMFPAFEGDAVIETADTGETALWAKVLRRIQDSALDLQWVAGHDPQQPTDVTVRFETAGRDETGAEQTEVTVVHDGFSRLPDPRETQAAFARSWDDAMTRYARFMGAR